VECLQLVRIAMSCFYHYLSLASGDRSDFYANSIKPSLPFRRVCSFGNDVKSFESTFHPRTTHFRCYHRPLRRPLRLKAPLVYQLNMVQPILRFDCSTTKLRYWYIAVGESVKSCTFGWNAARRREPATPKSLSDRGLKESHA
jgi:hypothetical protein